METIYKEQNSKIYLGEDFLKDLQQIFLENRIVSKKDIRDLLELSKRYMGFAYENTPVEVSDAEYSMILEKYA